MPAPLRPLLWTIALCVAVACARAGETVRWYAIDLDGQRAGWLRDATIEAEGTIRTERTMRLALARQGLVVELNFDAWFEETADGEPIAMALTQSTGGGATTTSVRFEPGQLVITETQNGRDATRREPAPEGAWLPPAAAERYFRARVAAGAAAITTRTIDPMGGIAPATTERTDPRSETVTVRGKPIETTRWLARSSATPGLDTLEWADASGLIVRTQTRLGGMALVMNLSTEADATAAGEAPEFLTTTFVRPSRAIRSPRTVTEGEYVLRSTRGPLQAIPDGGGQRTERIDDASVRVTVRAGRASAGEADEAALASSVLIDHEDPAVRALLPRALAGASRDRGSLERAEALRRFVYGHIRDKSLGVAIGSASSTARSGAGDCTEHAALLAALCRADGIPARLVVGLIYADRFAGERDIFGFHMWTRALVRNGEGERVWVDLDATLPSRRASDGTHIALHVTDGNDGVTGGGMARVVPLLGTLEIEVVRTSRGGGR